jgi:tetratricopeptide (TPR) repeat protein
MAPTVRMVLVFLVVVIVVALVARAATTDAEKSMKFAEIEAQFGMDPETVQILKAGWLISRGNARGEAGNLDAAIKDFREAISIKADHPAAYMSLATCFQQKKMYQEAIRILAGAPEYMKRHGEVIGDARFELNFYLAINYAQAGDKKSALAAAKRALSVRDDPKRLKVQRGAAAALGDDSLAAQEDEMASLLRKLLAELSG